MNDLKKCIAEFIGTAVLVIFGCGSAVAANTLVDYISVPVPLALTTLLIAFAFGLVIVAMAYSIGNISGCHINPAVSFAMLISGKMNAKEFGLYVVSQVLGAIAGAALLVVMFGSSAALGTNGYGAASALGANMGQCFLVEVVLTFVFITAILGVTSKEEFKSTTGLVIGLTLTLVHIFGVPFTGTSVNPARSLGPALLNAFTDITALSQVWLFIVAPLVGAGIAALVYNFLSKDAQ